MHPTLKKLLFSVYDTLRKSIDVGKRLRPINPKSFSRSLIRQEDLPFRSDLRKLGYPDVALDIGCGNGSFTTAYAKLQPKSLVLGIEIAGEYLHKGARKAERENIHSCKFIHGDGVFLLKTCIAPKTLKTIFFNFPDPWHKNRHRKRRKFTKEFMELCLSRLVEDGEFIFISDNPDIFAFALKNARLAVEGTPRHVIKENPPAWYPKSKYYEKWEEMGRTIQFFRIVKAKDQAITA